MSSVTVITREEIDASGASDLTGVLSRKAGINVVKSGGRAGDSKLFLRGANEDQVLFLLNGIRPDQPAQANSISAEFLPSWLNVSKSLTVHKRRCTVLMP